MTRVRLVGLACLLAVIVFASGCGDDDTAESETATEGVEEPTATPADEGDAADDASADSDDADGEGDGENDAGARAEAFPVTVTGDNGEVTLDAEPVAIVSLSPSLTEIVYAIGAGDQVIAVDGSSDYPAGTPVTDLSGFRPNVEAIGALQPDLVLLARDRDDVVATLEGVGIQVLVLGSASTVDDVERQILVLGDATGHPTEAGALAADMSAEIDELLGSLDAADEPLRYFYEASSDYYSLTSDTLVGSILAEAGLVNIADDVDPAAGPYPQLSAEYVLAEDPDLVFVAHTDGSEPTFEEISGREGWANLQAVVNGNVVILDPDIASRWGPRVVDLVEAVVGAVNAAGGDG